MATVPDASLVFSIWPDFQGPVVYCRVLHILQFLSEPISDATVVETKEIGDIIIVRNDAGAPDPGKGWLHVFIPDGVAFLKSAARADLEPLPYASAEVIQHIRWSWGQLVARLENLIISRWKKISQSLVPHGQLVALKISDEGSWHRSNGMPLPFACCHSSGLVLCWENGQRLIRSSRIFRRGSLVEACRVIKLKTSPGPALAPYCLELHDADSLGIPLGYGPFYCHGDSTTANVKATLKEWCGGGFVLLIYATCTIYGGQILVLEDKPIREDSMWSVRSVPKPPAKDMFCSLGCNLSAESGGMLNWGLSDHCAGTFAMRAYEANSILEICPAISLDDVSIKAAQDYCMAFDAFGTIAPQTTVLSFGLGALCNHKGGGENNAEFWYDSEFDIVAIIARKDIACGAEVLLDYGDNYWKVRT